jgi:hypothetical protein
MAKISQNPIFQITVFAFALTIFITVATYLLPWEKINWGKLVMGYNPTITVSGEAKGQQKNQVAQFSAGVNAVNDNKEVAINEVNTKIKEIIKIVKEIGIDEKDIKTQNLSIYQNQEMYYENDKQKTRFGQWNITNTIEIKLRNLEKVEALTEALSKSPANNIWGPNLSVEDTKELEMTLLIDAIKDAKEKASKVVQASSKKLGKIITINEDGISGSNTFYQGQNIDTRSFGGSIETGSATITKTVTVTFELE